MKNIILFNSGIRFLIEIFSFIMLIILGFTKFKLPVNLIIGIFIPVVLAVLWGVFVAPHSANRATEVCRIIIELLVFVTVFLVLKFSNLDKMAYVYLIVALINDLIVHIVN